MEQLFFCGNHNLMLPDLLNYLDQLSGRLQYGRLHCFTFVTSTGFTGVDVEMLLRQYGIRIWGRMIADEEELAFHVKQRQAVWAEYILCRAGVPLTCKLLDQRNAQYRQRHGPGAMPTPWDAKGIGPHSFVDHVVDWLDRLLG